MYDKVSSNRMLMEPGNEEDDGAPSVYQEHYYLLSQSTPKSIPTPRMLRNLVKIENFPALTFSAEYSTDFFSENMISSSLGYGAV